ncbi:ribonuclease catalytic domain-containing protein [Methyloversatilis sp.]|uniref:ribonuclease catalytic domain-containing protein n=2 Tax=Methyloversatilis sp. TaxID=2569862 RepID=UPI002732F976|nr:RNB domain-containing ribonuclease [Methyloversatilis sp.]MDP3456492.1 RNB domain-containing ribonuclease [Methyloversatilis sp.]MDP3576766.1 RNB domain-containing ribonuclease [Methyloversatilis sp.]
MNVLFEEDGHFRAGSVMTDSVSSLQVELPSGKRSKVKAANVLLRFASPEPGVLLAAAEAQAADLDATFLWDVCGDDEFPFEELAREYHGAAPTAEQAAAILLCLHAAPVYFHRKGKGRFRKAPPDILKAALAGLEKKRLQQEQVDGWVAELLAGRTPPDIAACSAQILYKPDRNRLETKAVEAAAASAGLSVVGLMAKAGAFASSHEYHLGRFLFEYFPRGTDFPTHDVPPAGDLPDAGVRAFSIDDATTTEIDDAFSVQPKAGGGWRIGIHIAAPSLGIQPGTPLGEIARSRLSTVYFPGRKITMLPDEAVDTYTLQAGRSCPALSLYLDVETDLRVTAKESRIEQVAVAANLRHHEIEPLFNEDTITGGELPEFEWRDELLLLWRLAEVLEAGRGKPSANAGQMDFNFYVDWSQTTEDGEGRVDIQRRARGSPLDKLVAELMIVANNTWGSDLRDAGIPALYRAQGAGKVRMTTVAAPHEGLGVDCYAWSTSPLRRYVDLVNQWQMIALLRGEEPVFPPKSEALLSALRDFELAYAAYADFQRGMERYWCLRWLRQQAREGNTVWPAIVLRESLVRLEHVPLVLRSPSLPARDPRSRVEVEIDQLNLLDNDARARWVGDLAALAGAAQVSEEELAEEIAEAELPPETPAADAPVPELPVAAPESGEAD